MSATIQPGGVLAIAAHPDDEVLGCGGVLARHARNGEPVTIAIVCEGRELTYKTLDTLANQLAWHLRSLGADVVRRAASA